MDGCAAYPTGAGYLSSSYSPGSPSSNQSYFDITPEPGHRPRYAAHQGGAAGLGTPSRLRSDATVQRTVKKLRFCAVPRRLAAHIALKSLCFRWNMLFICHGLQLLLGLRRHYRLKIFQIPLL